MSILKQVKDPENGLLPNLAITTRTQEPPASAPSGRSSAEMRQKRVPTQRSGYFTSQFATLNLKYYKDQVYVPADCDFAYDGPPKPQILRYTEALANVSGGASSASELRRILYLDNKISQQYNSVIKQRASQPTYHRERFVQRQKEAIQKSAFFHINTKNPAYNAFKRDFLSPDDASKLQGGYKLQHGHSTQITYQNNSFNRINGRPSDPPPIPQLPTLFSSRESLFECAVYNSVIKAVKEQAETAQESKDDNQENMQFMTEIRETEQPPAVGPVVDLARPAIPVGSITVTTADDLGEECFEGDWRWEEITERLGEFGDFDGV